LQKTLLEERQTEGEDLVGDASLDKGESSEPAKDIPLSKD